MKAEPHAATEARKAMLRHFTMLLIRTTYD
jgi:hypothetical protein